MDFYPGEPCKTGHSESDSDSLLFSLFLSLCALARSSSSALGQTFLLCCYGALVARGAQMCIQGSNMIWALQPVLSQDPGSQQRKP